MRITAQAAISTMTSVALMFGTQTIRRRMCTPAKTSIPTPSRLKEKHWSRTLLRESTHPFANQRYGPSSRLLLMNRSVAAGVWAARTTWSYYAHTVDLTTSRAGSPVGGNASQIAVWQGHVRPNAVYGPRVKEFRINSLTPMTPEPEAESCPVSGMAPQLRTAWRELHRPLRIGNPNA
jgi:hypothetical protein